MGFKAWTAGLAGGVALVLIGTASSLAQQPAAPGAAPPAPASTTPAPQTAAAAAAAFNDRVSKARMGLGVGGEFVFTNVCSACHVSQSVGGGDSRAPHTETLRQFSPEHIYAALTTGKMQAQGAGLTDAQKRDVSEWLSARRLGAADAGDVKHMTNRCKVNPGLPAEALAGPRWNGWSPGMGNARYQDARNAGLTAADLPKLRLKWAFGLPNGVESYSQPSVVAGRVYFGSDSGQVYAVDAKSGCVYWSYLAGAGVRSAPVMARLGGRFALYFADMKANAYAIDAHTGAQIWKVSADDQPLSRITGAAAVYGGKVFVSTSSSEEISGMQAKYECCRNRGTVSALDAATGKPLWKAYMLPPPTQVGVTADGRRKWGPAGVGIWSAPSVDPKRGVLYIGTGDSFTAPAAPLSDSIVALDLKTGKVVWSHQATPNDVYMTGCGANAGPNCPAKQGPDWDFGSSAVLQTLADGRQVVVGGHKGGGVIALDPDNKGALLWGVNLAAKPPSAGGDIVYGGAVGPAAAYYALQQTNAVAAVDAHTGKVLWKITPPASPEGRTERTGSAAAVTAAPGYVLSGGWDGVLRAYGAEDGRVLWSYDTVKPYTTVNGVEAKGGSLGAPGATVAGGMLFVGSGYVGTHNGMPGNVILAFGK
jgi:polyvinyl alcohol dehydrogenase (cytochrome)